MLAIERRSFEFPWRRSDFTRTLSIENVFVVAATCDGDVIGYAIVESLPTSYFLLNLAVEPIYRRCKVGQGLMRLLANSLQGRRRSISLFVRERNVPAQLFFRSLGYRAVEVLPGAYDETDEDAYLMRYVAPPTRKDSPQLIGEAP